MCNDHHTSDHLHNLRHSLSHVMAQAVQRVQQADVEIAIGPAIDNGFYYDFLFSPEKQIKDEDLPKINEMMVKIVKEGQIFTRLDVSNEESEHLVKDILKQKYKAELRDEFAAAGEGISFYLNSIPTAAKDHLLKGVNADYVKYYEDITAYFQKKHPAEFADRFITFLDMCEGPHVESMKEIDPSAFKVAKVAGAYWRGDEKNVMMTRLYAYAFEQKEELKGYLNFLEEAKKRDHRRLGKELDLFVFSDLVGPGLPIYTGRGNTIRKEIIAFSNELQSKIGYEEVHTPNMNKAELFKISGHYDKYKDDMIIATSHYSDEEYYLKPMNCPQHTQVYASRPRSYKDLPVRIADFANLYRDERPGELNGLTRLRCFCQDDGHCFCREDQIQQEFESVLEAIKIALTTYGMPYKVRLSLWDPKHKEKYLGSEDIREKSQTILEQILIANQIEYFKAEGEAAFY
jgi:threonyl-tRNA synthetase